MRDDPQEEVQRMIVDMESFICGTLDIEAIFADWRYAEAPAFQNDFSLQIQEIDAGFLVTHRVYSKEIVSRKLVSERFATLHKKLWDEMQCELAQISVRVPPLGNAGRDGTVCSLRVGRRRKMLVTWQAGDSDELGALADHATKWRDKLLALDWQNEER